MSEGLTIGSIQSDAQFDELTCFIGRHVPRKQMSSVASVSWQR